MKLAEALALRADRQRYLAQLKSRLLANAKVQEGDTPAEDPEALLNELEQVTGELERLIQRINRTNAATVLEPGVTVTDALAIRDMLQTKQGIYRELGQAASVIQSRLTRSEVKFRSAVDVAAAHQTANDLARQFRELDVRIQEKNWLTELVD